MEFVFLTNVLEVRRVFLMIPVTREVIVIVRRSDDPKVHLLYGYVDCKAQAESVVKVGLPLSRQAGDVPHLKVTHLSTIVHSELMYE